MRGRSERVTGERGGEEDFRSRGTERAVHDLIIEIPLSLYRWWLSGKHTSCGTQSAPGWKHANTHFHTHTHTNTAATTYTGNSLAIELVCFPVRSIECVMDGKVQCPPKVLEQ